LPCRPLAEPGHDRRSALRQWPRVGPLNESFLRKQGRRGANSASLTLTT
jgi:hypothetical protein